MSPRYYILFTYLFIYYFHHHECTCGELKQGSLLHPPAFTTDRIRDVNIADDVSPKIPYARLIGFKHWNLLPLKITVLTFHFSWAC